ncbi:hypothetical protein AJ78_00828 [Emergomyces pasteurianus Ep9510]|uniref:Hydrophobin n=1 Tax=Emergomyces pasteurianus Ep9510 TaxID=1447872 RepID=A0A1J9QSN9_9EURO|nr:hypothetical protein AJ78_00828 [Emergomyces pasteurianus Ep9510]
MKFSMPAVVLALAAVAVAAPGGSYKSPNGDIDVNQITKQCGQAQVSCCNKQVNTVKGGDTNSGLLNGVLGTVIGGGSEIGIFDQCSKLSVAALIGLADILGGPRCGQVACCQGDSSAEGLVALNLPCIPIAGL